ncbi:sensor histidine kinase [Candidatus Viridilinea mediisalina]|uniref:histidine kinase n=1 Tax=Candidatus Viridilinea mediisalina TaxID=2024553 RepID=A0A2A6RGI7_9CHLR|nr:HAMP domain-containing sensor histidine kinase [Candidatus Viridilinea mediisalina]PDW01995.1 two-component sensor histidine kinase [Candidatus Viridilinea mediisalina]
MSFRLRLTLIYTGFFALALLLLGWGIYFSVRQSLYTGVQRDLWAATHQVRRIFSAGGLEPIRTPTGELRLFLRSEFIQIFNNPNLVAQVFRTDGDMLDSTPNLGGRVLPIPEAALNMTGDDVSTGYSVVREVDNTRIESLITPLVIDGSTQVVGFLQISRPLRDVDRTLGMLTGILVGGGAIALLITGAGTALIAGRVLKPVDQITHTAQGIVHAEDLAQRVPVPLHHDELHRLTVTINDLLARLEALFTAQRRFVADVSHELRTPLAAMQGNLEILQRGGLACPEIAAETVTDMRRETARLIRMVNDLLLLAQSDAFAQQHREPVELDTLLLEVYRELRPLAGDVGLRIGAEDQVTVCGDRDRLKQALLNLGVNALQYTPPGGTVTLALECHEELACLSIADTGVGIAEADLPHIFERFYRADRARTRHSGGAGLGLSIVKRVAEAHQGHATVASIAGQGSTFAIWLPLNGTEPHE